MFSRLFQLDSITPLSTYGRHTINWTRGGQGELMRPLRSLLRTVVSAQGMSGARAMVWLQNARADSSYSSRMAQIWGYRDLHADQPLFARDSNNVLFILGSGSSINNLRDHNFREISEHSSIGINVWAVHHFVPDVYSFEYDKQQNPQAPDLLRVQERLSRPEVLERKPRFIHLRPSSQHLDVPLLKLPHELESQTYMYGRANMIHSSVNGLDRDLMNIMSGYDRGWAPSNVLPDNGASVVRLLFLGLRQGFKKIVLVGIDLNASPYFWYDKKSKNYSERYVREFPRPPVREHDTLETLDRPFRTDDVIYAIARVAKSMRGAEIFVGDPSSSLSSQLNTYPWRQYGPLGNPV